MNPPVGRTIVPAVIAPRSAVIVDSETIFIFPAVMVEAAISLAVIAPACISLAVIVPVAIFTAVIAPVAIFVAVIVPVAI